MVPQQKEALLVLVASTVFAALVWPLRLALPALECEAVFLDLLAFIAVLWIGRQLVGLKARALDERDLAIRYRAAVYSTHLFGAVVMVGAMALWAAHRTTLAVPAAQVALLATFAWMAMYLAWSLSVLVLYRRGI